MNARLDDKLSHVNSIIYRISQLELKNYKATRSSAIHATLLKIAIKLQQVMTNQIEQNLVVFFRFREQVGKLPTEDKRNKYSKAARVERKVFSVALFYLIKNRFDITHLSNMTELTDHCCGAIMRACRGSSLNFLSYSQIKKINAVEKEVRTFWNDISTSALKQPQNSFLLSIDNLEIIQDPFKQINTPNIKKLEFRLLNSSYGARSVSFELEIFVDDKLYSKHPLNFVVGRAQNRNNRSEINSLLNRELKIGNFFHRVLGLTPGFSFIGLRYLLNDMYPPIQDKIDSTKLIESEQTAKLVRYKKQIISAISGSDHKAYNHCKTVACERITLICFQGSRKLRLIHASGQNSGLFSSKSQFLTAYVEIPENTAFKDLKPLINFEKISLPNTRSKRVRLHFVPNSSTSDVDLIGHTIQNPIEFKFEHKMLNQEMAETIFADFVIVDLSSVKKRLAIGYRKTDASVSPNEKDEELQNCDFITPVGS